MNPLSIRQLSVILALFLFAPIAFAKKVKDPSAHDFQTVEAEAKKFEKDKKSQKFRHNFEKMAAKWERFAKKHGNSDKAALALKKAAELYQRVADISQYTPNYQKAANVLLAAAEKTSKAAEQDEILMRVMRLYVVQLADRQGAADAIGPFLAKQRAKKRKLANAEAWLAEFQKQKKVAAKAIAVAKKEKSQNVEDEEEPLKLTRIKKVEMIKSEESVGLSIVSSGDIHIKQGVIPRSGTGKRRVFFDISRSELDPSVKTSFEVTAHGISNIRLAQNKTDVVRIVAEAEESMPIHVKADGVPIEIWFGQTPTVEDEEEAEEVAKTPKRIKEDDSPLGLALRKIVIDPGHGGHDPGAIGKGGLKEKDVTLAMAKKLKSELEESMPGVRVYLTRDTDKYLTLGERTEFANNLEADLFISVHVNSSPNRKTQGIETYYLNISHDRYAVRLASRENAMSETEISNLEFILADLAMKSNVSDSIRLGREVQASTHSHVQSTWNDVKDLGLKHALFYVLLGARMPAVLVETAFISNKADEKRLRTDPYQKAIVAGMAKGIIRYSEQKQALYQP